ncbi:MAG: hypothetical protein SFU98_21615 [Leptospiraceae bacterium]|nr:hypothetical protein [Leptospiraceae bacterium]
MIFISYKKIFFSLKELKSLDGTDKEDEYVIDSIKLFLRLGINSDNRQLPYKVFNPLNDIYYVEIEDYKESV